VCRVQQFGPPRFDPDQLGVQLVETKRTQARAPRSALSEQSELVPGFVGRKWVLRELEQWLGSPDSEAMLLLVGDPGTFLSKAHVACLGSMLMSVFCARYWQVGDLP
jgi:hypothetical protein